MQAVCYKCGGEKNEPMKMCAHCHTLPELFEDQILSMGLSTDCIRAENVQKAGKYIRKKGRPPKLHTKVRAKAKKLVRAYQPQDLSASMEMSASFFDMSDLIEDESAEEVLELVGVHMIGKPANGEFTQLSNESTYIESTWTVGIDISEEDFARHVDDGGEIYVWYRWSQEKWQPKFVSKDEFEQLKQLSQES